MLENKKNLTNKERAKHPQKFIISHEEVDFIIWD